MSADARQANPPGLKMERKFAGGHAQLERLPNRDLSFRCLPFNSQIGYRLSVPSEHAGDPWSWFRNEGHLGAIPESEFLQACKSEAYALGYRLLILDLINEPQGYRWEASAAPLSGYIARSLAWAVLRDDAAELGVELLQQIAAKDRDWPEEPVLSHWIGAPT